MAIVITVAQQKGGAGKTTLAANLGAALAGSHRVALLDIDPQRSLARWHALRAGLGAKVTHLTFSDVSGWRLGRELDRLRAEHDFVLIDSPPQIDTDARLAIRGADLVLVPIQPSMPDLWAAEGTLKLAADEKRSARLVLNRAPGGSRLRDRVEADIAERKLPIFATSLGNRAGFANAFAVGLGVTEASPRPPRRTSCGRCWRRWLPAIRTRPYSAAALPRSCGAGLGSTVRARDTPRAWCRASAPAKR